jgi:hypothetical protein
MQLCMYSVIHFHQNTMEFKILSGVPSIARDGMNDLWTFHYEDQKIFLV